MLLDGVPIVSYIPKNDQGGVGDLGSSSLYFLNGMEGYDVAHNQFPDTQGVTFYGRNLNASDAGTNNVLLNDNLENAETIQGTYSCWQCIDTDERGWKSDEERHSRWFLPINGS